MEAYRVKAYSLTFVRIIRNCLFDTKKSIVKKIWGDSNGIVFVGCTQRWRWTKNYNQW